jgi:hypothetical protein
MTLIRQIVAGCKLGISGTVELANDTDVDIEFTTEGWDDGGFHDGVTNRERITIPANLGGRYQFSARAAFDADVLGDRYASITRRNSSDVVMGQISNLIPAPSLGLNSVEHSFPLSDVFKAEPGDYFILTLKQTSTSALDARMGTTFTCQRISS